MQLMRRSMKRLKTFKQMRPTEGASNDPNSIPLESIGGKHTHPLIVNFIPLFVASDLLDHNFLCFVLISFNIYFLYIFPFVYLHV